MDLALFISSISKELESPCIRNAIMQFSSRSESHEFQGYGSTEAGGISLMIAREECSRIGSAGRVAENAEVKIVDPVTGKPLSVGKKGELLVKGPAVMTGNDQSRIPALLFMLTVRPDFGNVYELNLCRIRWRR